MREKPTPRAATICQSAKLVCIVVCLALAGGTLQAGEEPLPEKAKSVAEKFTAYQKTATPAEIKSKRIQVIEYLGGILKQEAADADLDGALAVKALIERIKNGDNQPAPKGDTAVRVEPVSTSASSGPAAEGLAQTSFSLGEVRRLEFSFHVAKGRKAKTLRCEFEGASDDSGDRGLNYELIDPRGEVVKGGFLQSSHADIVVHQTKSGGRWKLVVIDEDTELGEVHPGNTGSVRVTVMRPDALALRRPAR